MLQSQVSSRLLLASAAAGLFALAGVVARRKNDDLAATLLIGALTRLAPWRRGRGAVRIKA